MADFTRPQRLTLAKKGEAMSGGRYPIRNTSDLQNAIQAYGRSKTPAATRAWIKKRAAALGASKTLPASWL